MSYSAGALQKFVLAGRVCRSERLDCCEKTRDARVAADEARDIADSFNNLANPKNKKVTKPGGKRSVEKDPNVALTLTCATGFVLGFFSSHIARNLNQSQCSSVIRQRIMNQRISSSCKETEVVEAGEKAKEKLAEAYAVKKSAYDMAVFALNERLAAGKARRSYEACSKRQ